MEARPAAYVEMHHKLVAAVESCLPVEQARSIDEMCCRLHGSDAQRDKAQYDWFKNKKRAPKRPFSLIKLRQLLVWIQATIRMCA